MALGAELSIACLVVISVKHEVLSEPKIVAVEKLKGDVSNYVVNYLHREDAYSGHYW